MSAPRTACSTELQICTARPWPTSISSANARTRSGDRDATCTRSIGRTRRSAWSWWRAWLPAPTIATVRRIRAGEQIRRDRPRCSRAQLRQIAVVEEQADKAAVESAQHEHQPAVTHGATVAGVEIGGDLDGPDTILVEMAGLDVREALRVGEIERAHIR